MQRLKDAIAYAAGRNRVPVRQTDPPISLRGLSWDVGLPPPVSLLTLSDTLLLPGNFMPGQPLATGNEVGEATSWYQADVFAIGLDGTPWKFWEYNDGPWMNGDISNEHFAEASVPVDVMSTFAWGPDSIVLQMCSPAFTETDLAMFNQNPDGKWDPLIVSIDSRLPGRGHVAHFFSLNAVVAVDSNGTLQLFRQESGNPALPMKGTALSGPGFAPPGAPVAVDVRVIGLLDGVDQGGDAVVFVVNTVGELWVFNSPDFGDTWSSAAMPNPNGVKVAPGAHIATGNQVSVQSVGLGGQSLGYCQLDVFVIDTNGNLQVWWESQGSEWNQNSMPDGSGLPPGAPIAAGLQVYELPWLNVRIGNQLDVFVTGFDGRVARWWVYRTGSWSHDFLPDEHLLPPGAHLATTPQQVDGDRLFHQLDVFGVGLDGRIIVFWQTQGFDWTSEIMPGSDIPVLPPPM